MIKTAAQILAGAPRPTDTVSYVRNPRGRPRMYGPTCMECGEEPHYAKGLGRLCWGKWHRKKDGPIQPFKPVRESDKGKPCKQAPLGCAGIVGGHGVMSGNCSACYVRVRRFGDPQGHSTSAGFCRSTQCCCKWKVPST